MNQKHDPISQQLCEEARANDPQFSAQRHTRIMRLIEADSLSARAPLPISRHLSRIIRPAAAIAAAALVILAVWKYQHPLIAPPTIVARVQPSLPPFDLHFADISRQADRTLTEARFGYLDRDAKNAVHYVMDQFDVMPRTPARRG